MNAKYIVAAAAALFASTGASAQPLNASAHGGMPARAAASARHAVLDNIIGRVQMDALINTIVDTEGSARTQVVSDAVATGDTKSIRDRRAVAYAANAPATVRTRS